MKQSFGSTKEGLSRFWRNMAFTVKESWRVSPALMLVKLTLYMVQGLMPIILAFLAGKLIDSIIDAIANNGDISASLVLIIIIGVASFIFGQSQRLTTYYSRKFEAGYELRMNQLLQSKFGQLDHSYYEDSEFNKLLNKVQQNFGRIFRFMDELFYLFASIVQLVASGIALVFLNPLVTFLLVLGILPLLRAQMQGARDRWRFWEEADQDWRLRHNIRSSFMDTESIGEHKIFQLPKYLLRMWRRFFDRSTEVLLGIERKIRNRQFLASFGEAGVQIGIDIWLLLRVVRVPAFTLGNFEFYRRVIGGFSNAMSRLLIGLQTVNEVGLYVNDFQDFLDLEPRIKEARERIKLPVDKMPKIEFRNVSFKYPNSDEYVLKNINFTIKPGEDIAIVGENGAGKTTLIKLLMRFYDVTDGKILINGTNIKDIDLNSWYFHVGALFQRFNTYNYFKAKRSIGVGNVEQVDNLGKIKEAGKKAGAHNFLNKLPRGYDTVLSKVYREGTELSGGEWQRIALARAFFRNADILILDEPTAAIDAEGEYEIFKRIADTQQDKTTIIISHRFSTVRNANKIYVIEDGHVKEKGSHQNLMQLENGTYKEMFELQAEGYK